MTETNSLSSDQKNPPSSPTASEKENPPLRENVVPPAERSKLSGASFLKMPSEPIPDPTPDKKDTTDHKSEKAHEEAELHKAQEEEKKKFEAEQEAAKQKAENEARRELTEAQIKAKSPKSDQEMLEELNILTATKNLTPSQLGEVLQWLIKREILQSERIKNLQKEITKLSQQD